MGICLEKSITFLTFEETCAVYEFLFSFIIRDCLCFAFGVLERMVEVVRKNVLSVVDLFSAMLEF